MFTIPILAFTMPIPVFTFGRSGRSRWTDARTLVFGRLPGCAGYTAYLSPPISRRDEEGFSSCSTRPGHRAVAPTPPEEPPAPASLRRTLLPSPRIRGLGLRDWVFRGHLCVHLRYGPVTHSPPPSVAWSMGFRASVSLRPAIRVTRRLALASAGLTPAERVSLHWTHGFEPVFQP